MEEIIENLETISRVGDLSYGRAIRVGIHPRPQEEYQATRRAKTNAENSRAVEALVEVQQEHRH